MLVLSMNTPAGDNPTHARLAAVAGSWRSRSPEKMNVAIPSEIRFSFYLW